MPGWQRSAPVLEADRPVKVIRSKPGVGFSAGKRLELDGRWRRRGYRVVFA